MTRAGSTPASFWRTFRSPSRVSLIRQELLGAFKQMSTDLGITVVIVEQQIQEALGYAQRALILDHGAVAHEAPAEQLRDDTATLERYISMAVH